MNTKVELQDFMAQRTLAIVGVSRNQAKFGNVIFSELKNKGYKLYPINPHMESIQGDKCYPDLKSLPETPGGVVIVVSPAQAVQVVKDAAAAGIKRIWLQQGAQSAELAHVCRENEMQGIYGHCLLMFAEPTSVFHRMHRGVWRMIGKLPA